MKVHNEKEELLSSVDKIEKKGKEIKKKHWVISGIGIVVLLLLGPLKKLIERFL